MDKLIPQTAPTPANGIFVRGIVVSNRAKAFRRKDGSGISVIVEHEIALQPGVATWARYLDPTAVRLRAVIASTSDFKAGCFVIFDV